MNLNQLFDDCHRRVAIQQPRNGGAIDFDRLWAALCMPSEITGAAREFFVPAHDEIPRVLNWYKLTPAGIEEYKRRYDGKPNWKE